MFGRLPPVVDAGCCLPWACTLRTGAVAAKADTAAKVVPASNMLRRLKLVFSETRSAAPRSLLRITIFLFLRIVVLAIDGAPSAPPFRHCRQLPVGIGSLRPC